MAKAPPCLHCGAKARLTTGAEIYPHRPDLFGKFFWKCDKCDATCGCHPKRMTPLGYPADSKTRAARRQLHNLRLDPLWKEQPTHRQKFERSRIYAFLAKKMGLPPEQTHTGMFTVEQCREAWKFLGGFK